MQELSDTQQIIRDARVIRYSTNGEVVDICYSTILQASRSADWIHLVLKESEARSIFDTQVILIETRSTFDTQQSCGTEALMGDAINTQGIFRDAIVCRYSRNLWRHHRYLILKESSETPLLSNTKVFVRDAIIIRYSTKCRRRDQFDTQ